MAIRMTPSSAASTRGGEPPDLEKALKNAPSGTARILLSHRPNMVVPAVTEGVDLQLSAHTHGGIVLGLDRLVARYNARFVSGLYRVGDMTLYVTRGSGIWNGFPVRLGVPSEITLLKLLREK
ncbi:MAG: putative metallophosphoesterase [Lentisphaerae bacterium ADurb.Bin242]|nr:MAG: putative metallophosphoesterase [Lentisphaerae bacterium ADurb.Bin242]